MQKSEKGTRLTTEGSERKERTTDEAAPPQCCMLNVRLHYSASTSTPTAALMMKEAVVRA